MMICSDRREDYARRLIMIALHVSKMGGVPSAKHLTSSHLPVIGYSFFIDGTYLTQGTRITITIIPKMGHLIRVNNKAEYKLGSF